ncbi:alpha/beta-hydrolase [Trichoderma compactum]
MRLCNVQEQPEATVFYVGGEYIQDARGTRMTGSMCVQRYGKKVPGQPAIVFVRGAAQTRTRWEATPDNRPGLALLQVADNWECHVVDQPGVGRSRYHAADVGDLTHYTRGDPVFNAFYASQVGHIDSYAKVESLFRPAIKALLKKIGPAFLITHSQSGPLGWHAADACPELVCGIVALEPHGTPFQYPDCPLCNSQPEIVGKLIHPFGITSTPLRYDPPLPEDADKLSYGIQEYTRGLIKGPRQERLIRRLKNLGHILVVLVTAEASHHAGYDHLTAEFLRDAGVPIEHVYLADQGIRGNGHMMAIEKNNKGVQQYINKWLRKQVPHALS